jgi:GR25 family glycosyltransferase involved in LPS biosynthesis
MNLETTPKCLINLPSRTDRLKLATIQIDSFFDNKAVKYIDGVKDSKPVIGIAKAHLNAISYAKDNDLDNVIIMEDDVLFRANGKRYAEKCFNNLPNDYDLLLGGIYQSNGLTKYNDYWSKTQTFSGLHFYIVNKQAYDKILNGYKFNCHIDRYMAGVGKLNCYVTNKLFAIQQNGYSDNSKMFCDYNHLLEPFELL